MTLVVKVLPLVVDSSGKGAPSSGMQRITKLNVQLYLTFKYTVFSFI